MHRFVPFFLSGILVLGISTSAVSGEFTSQPYTDRDSGAAATAEGHYPYPEWQQYPGRRGYGLGYPHADQGAYPYRGRGAGYGPGRRGYGYGYPGYRGRGGTGYPGHRQYGNPPFYRADVTE